MASFALRSRLCRRLLINYRADPRVVRALLPAPFEPDLVDGAAVVGVCAIHLAQIRPSFFGELPVGVQNQGAAHRIAVSWLAAGERRHGVYIVRRDTNSALVAWAGGRLFPGAHHHAHFDVRETATSLALSMRAADGTAVVVDGEDAAVLPCGSIFGSLEAASRFFEAGALGYSPARAGGLEAFTLEAARWQVAPFAVRSLVSSMFDDAQRFPRGSIEFDHALVMRDTSALWRTAPALSSADSATPAAPGDTQGPARPRP